VPRSDVILRNSELLKYYFPPLWADTRASQ
jgi:hypothetical protein